MIVIEGEVEDIPEFIYQQMVKFSEDHPYHTVIINTNIDAVYFYVNNFLVGLKTFEEFW